MNPLNHVAIIMDGNGRWGLKNGNSRNTGHKAGLKTVEKIINNPPIVGVPVFSFCPFKPKSLTVSPICFLFKNSIILFPYFNEINKEKINAKDDLKEIY